MNTDHTGVEKNNVNLDSLGAKFPSSNAKSNLSIILLMCLLYFLAEEGMQLTISHKQKSLVTASCCLYPPPVTPIP